MSSNKIFNIKTSYIVIFLSLTAWAFFAFFTMNELIKSQKAYGKIINMSGKQRMLSQKTALFVNKILNHQSKKDMDKLNNLILLMKKDHDFLINNLTSNHMRSIYFQDPYNLNNNVQKYFTLLDNFSNTYNNALLLEIDDYAAFLLPKLDHAVNEFEKESDLATEKLQQRELFILIGTLCTLFIEVIFIMFPSLRLLKESREKLVNFNKELKEEVDRQTIQIQKDNELIRFYLDTINSIIIALDEKANINMINKKGLDILGVGENDIIGKNWFSINVVPGEEQDRDKEFFNKLIENNIDISHSNFESRLISKNGEVKTFTWSNAVMKDNDQIIGTLSSGIDITNEKIQESIITEQSKMAAMGEMIGNIAHQWRQPLSVISTAASGLQVKKEYDLLEDDFLLKTLQEIVDHAQYLSKTIDTFRDFLREDKVLKEVVLQDRINKALEIVGTALKNNHIKLISNIDKVDAIKINLVIGELSQVIINLLNNSKDAIKENDIDAPWVKIDLIKEDGKIIITVEDNAKGIPDDVMPHIFEPYFTTKEKSQGTGLGLHMSYKIITNSLNGRIWAENSENGAKFFIELPIAV